jgi:hypothetical protein
MTRQARIAAVPTDERRRNLLERVVTLYCRNLQQFTEPKQWLGDHGIGDTRLWETFRLGYGAGTLRSVLPSGGETASELTALGIFDCSGAEFFRECITCPITDDQGQVETIVGWRLNPRPTERALLTGEAVLWNRAKLDSATDIYAATTVLDGLSVVAAGIANVVAAPEGAILNVREQIRKYGVRRATLVIGGASAANSTTERLGFDRAAAVVLPGVSSVNEYLTRNGREDLAAVIAARAPDQPGVDGAELLPDGFILEAMKHRYEVRGLERGARRLKATVRMESAGRMHVDTLDLYSARDRRRFVRDLVRIRQEPVEVFEGDLQRLITVAESRATQLQVQESTSPSVTLTEAERKEAEALARNPDLIKQILTDFEHCGLVGERTNKLLCYLAITSRKLPDPLAILILASSGAGKSALQEAAVAFCPPEDLVKVTSLSGKALFYKQRASLKHKVLAVEEGDGVGAASYALRNLISAGELVIESTMRDPGSGRLVTMANKVEGPTAVLVTTTNPETDPETKSRFIVTSIDEGPEQTQSILAWQRRQHGVQGLSHECDCVAVTHRHWALQRLLETVAVVNPYAEQMRFGDDRLTSRRDQPKYFRLISAVAFLRQRQKPVKHSDQKAYVEVDREDVRLANEIATALFGHTLGELSRPGHELLLLLGKMRGEAAAKDGFSFCRRDVREFGRWSHARVHRYLSELLDLEYVSLERRAGRHVYRLRWDGTGRDGERFLLGLKRPEDLVDGNVSEAFHRPERTPTSKRRSE